MRESAMFLSDENEMRIICRGSSKHRTWNVWFQLAK